MLRRILEHAAKRLGYERGSDRWREYVELTLIRIAQHTR